MSPRPKQESGKTKKADVRKENKEQKSQKPKDRGNAPLKAQRKSEKYAE